jgi:hypothetical protein
MTYVKNTWVDQEGQVRYRETQDGDLKIFTPNYEQVTEIGTPVNADNMNHIEDGIADCYTYVDSKITEMLQLIYPVGSTYISTSNTNPLEALFGTWELVSAGRVLQGADSNHAAGTTIAAGLPNITGQAQSGTPGNKSNMQSGAMQSISRGGGRYVGSGDPATYYYIDFNASRSSSIYGASNTVQPPAYVVNIWRRTA